MREIKFRAWDGEKMHKVCRLGLGGFSHDLWSPSSVGCKQAFNNSVEIMQFTGLKDKNGVEIYEGDLISWTDPEVIAKVVFSSTKASFGFEFLNENLGFFSLPGTTPSCEVIGNVREDKNPQAI